jgi:hypothetical protein
MLNPFRTMRRVRQAIAAIEAIPSLQNKVDQIMVAYQKDARFVERLDGFRERMDPARISACTKASVMRAPLGNDPCPHVVIDELVPDDFLRRDAERAASPVFFKQETGREEMQVPLPFAPAYSRLVWDFFFVHASSARIVPAAEEKFSGALDALLGRYWPRLGSWRKSGVRLSVRQFRDCCCAGPATKIRPHRDPRWAFVTCLVYLQKRDAPHVYGTQLLRLRNEREPTHSSPFWVGYDECELVKDVPGGRNSALMFVNSTGMHAASIDTDAPADLERYVYQVQFGPDEATRQELIASLSERDRPGWTLKSSAY